MGAPHEVPQQRPGDRHRRRSRHDAVLRERTRLHQKNGAKIIEEIADRAWDARQYVIEDPNGYFIKVAQPIDEVADA
ncbi:MAG TPA: hypothetical protein VGQ27_02215 [Steroidobacteraceae bacterium]|jgi:uncharacterized glyoxalase superfamily protein PhnB|nr:hypothetical protein [Steroidobacteraceae bacterium]